MTTPPPAPRGIAQGRRPRLVGGRLCLDFANSVGGRGGESPDEYLWDYADLVAWGRYAGVLTDEQASRLFAGAKDAPGEAAVVLRRAVALRETIYRAFSAVGRGERPAPADLDALREAHAAALGHARLVAGAGGVVWVWNEDENALDRVLWPVVWSAVEALTGGERDRIKECPGGGGGPCTWLFVDTSKNAVRRWCSMAECGGEAKARRQTARRRAARVRR